MPDTVRFILLATQRTGSSWVQEALNSHPEMRVHTELYLAEATGHPMWEPTHIEFVESYLERNAAGSGRLARSYWRLRFLRRIFGQSDVRAVGFKYMYDQIPRSPEVLPYAAVTRARVVHLLRRNLLDTVISAKLAQVTRLYHLAGDDRPPVPWWPTERREAEVRLPAGELLGELTRLERERRRIRAWLRASRAPTHEVEYEALAADMGAFGPVLEFLGLPAADAARLGSALQKLRTKSQSEVVENYDEVSAVLHGTPYEHFLEA